MDIYSISPNGHRFQGNRDIPLTSQPQFFGIPEVIPEELIDSSSHHHAIQYLKSVDKLFIQQNIALLEMVLEIEVNNKYQVLNPFGQRVFLALEESGCCAQIWCGPIRSFEMHLTDNLNHEVIRMYRHLACHGCPFLRQKLEIFCPTDVLVAFVMQEFTFLHPRFGIFDKDGMKVLQIEGPICPYKCCSEICYQITGLNGEFVGTISKQWAGFIQEGFTDADSFRLEFSLDLDVYIKMALLGATFLIDYLYYEKDRSLI